MNAPSTAACAADARGCARPLGSTNHDRLPPGQQRRAREADRPLKSSGHGERRRGKGNRRHVARARAGAVVERPRAWVAGGEGPSRRRVAVSWWSRYRGIDGPLQSLLLTVYVFLAVLPA